MLPIQWFFQEVFQVYTEYVRFTSILYWKMVTDITLNNNTVFQEPHHSRFRCIFTRSFINLIHILQYIPGEQHVKKIYSTVAIDKLGHALKPVRGYSFTGEDTNTRVPWLLKNEICFNIFSYISFMRTHIYKFLLMGNSHIIGDFKWTDCCGLSSIGL